MRHRSSLPVKSEPRNHDKNQLQNEVIHLRRVIRMQNQAIVGLSSCFAIVIISTLLLIQRLPSPNDGPFWESTNDLRDERREERPKRQPRGKRGPHHLPTAAAGANGANCSSYGCPIRPVEMSLLRNATTDRSSVASPNHVMLTHKSNRKKPAPVNQDRAVLVPSFGNEYDRTTDATTTIDPGGNFFAGIFDGHDDNGHVVARFASEEIPSRIASGLRDASLSMEADARRDPSHRVGRDEVERIVARTFGEVDGDAPVDGGGCTATMMLRRGYALYMANAGDSTSFLVIYRPPSRFDEQRAASNERYVSSPRSPNAQLHLQGTVSIHHLNEKHKPHLPKEHDRITSLGGRVHIPPKNPMGSRVIVRSAMHGEDVGLAMSRSIGDREWTAVGVIPDPDIVVLDLRKFWFENEINDGKAKVAAVVGSDGLFDARKPEFVANHLAYGLFESRSSRERNARDGQDPERESADQLIDVAKKLVDMASPLKEEWYRDDITFVANVIEL